MNFGADRASGFSNSKIWQNKGDIIEIIVAGGILFFLKVLLEITSGQEYFFAHRLLFATAAASLLISAVFVRLNSDTALVHLFGLFDKDNIDAILKCRGTEGFLRRFYNYPYYAAHIFLVLYSIEYFILPYYPRLTDFNPIDKMYFIISIIAIAIPITFFASIMQKRNISRHITWFFLTTLFYLIGWAAISFPDRIRSLMSFSVGIPPIVSAYVLVRSIKANRVEN